MIPRGSEPRQGTPISLVAIHTAEGATTVESLASYLDQPGVEASYHVLVDDSRVFRYLAVEDQAAWAMLSGNHRSVQLCFTGFAEWSRAEWLTHDHMLRSGAAVVADWCAKYRIPIAKLTPAQVSADQPGICGHWDWTLGKHDGTHIDPGPNFPWDVFISYVQAIGEADMTPEESSILRSVHTQMSGPGATFAFAGWPARPDNTPAPKSLVDYVRGLHAMLRVQAAQLDAMNAKIDQIVGKP